MLYLIVSLNLVSTIFGIYWLRQKVSHQATIIEDQTKQIANLDKYSNLLTQLTDKLDPNSVLKLLDVERTLMTKETELLRADMIKKINQQLKTEWGTVVKNRVIPLYESSMTEFSNFIFFYFSNHHYTDKDVRNGDIRLYFPNNADMIIAYLDEVREKQPDQESNP